MRTIARTPARLLLASAALMLAAAVFLLVPGQAQAASVSGGGAYKTIEIGKTVTKYDVTGDKKADSVLVEQVSNAEFDNDAYCGLRVTINGKVALNVTDTYYYYAQARFVKLGRGVPYLYISTTSDNDYRNSRLYRYVNGVLKTQINFTKLFGGKGGTHIDGVVSKVTKNTITVRAQIQSNLCGTVQGWFTYKYKSGKLVRSNATSTVRYYAYYTSTGKSVKNGYVTTAAKVKGYKSASLKGATVTFAKGTKVKITHMRWYMGKLSFKVRAKSGKAAWVPNPSRSNGNTVSSTWFKEMYRAG